MHSEDILGILFNQHLFFSMQLLDISECWKRVGRKTALTQQIKKTDEINVGQRAQKRRINYIEDTQVRQKNHNSFFLCA